METFGVAIWEKWGSAFPEHTELVEASSALAALEQVMRISGIQRASRAAVSPVGISCISRYERLRLTLPSLEAQLIP